MSFEKFENFNKEKSESENFVPELNENQRIALRQAIRDAQDRYLDSANDLTKSMDRGDSREISDRLAIRLAEAADEKARLERQLA